jgi:hypothetical protein
MSITNRQLFVLKTTTAVTSLRLNLRRLQAANNHTERKTLKLCALLGAFSKLGKATLSFDVSVCLSAWNNATSTDFHEI